MDEIIEKLKFNLIDSTSNEVKILFKKEELGLMIDALSIHHNRTVLSDKIKTVNNVEKN